ncbi:hypothetical protein TrVFT333_007925 [Trichoderma virens FT-333]|nr:hypothetical protein TrVFT333_007925 [Trichoderma virens FT-333]
MNGPVTVPTAFAMDIAPIQRGRSFMVVILQSIMICKTARPKDNGSGGEEDDSGVENKFAAHHIRDGIGGLSDHNAEDEGYAGPK